MVRSSPGSTGFKARTAAAVDARAGQLTEISHRIHENPELGFEEHFAHDLLAGAAEEAGLEVQRQAYGVETAFAARAGTAGPLVAFLCEYDALPGIGHACGHTISAASGRAATSRSSSAARTSRRLGLRIGLRIGLWIGLRIGRTFPGARPPADEAAPAPGPRHDSHAPRRTRKAGPAPVSYPSTTGIEGKISPNSAKRAAWQLETMA